jgi:hypothetical protein
METLLHEGEHHLGLDHTITAALVSGSVYDPVSGLPVWMFEEDA